MKDWRQVASAQTGIMLTPSPLPGEDRELSILTNEDYCRGENIRFLRYSYRLDGFVSLPISAVVANCLQGAILHSSDLIGVKRS